MYRFLLRPKWILSHLLVLALIIAMINLALWQVRRLDEKKAANAQVEHNTKLDPLDLGEATAVVKADGADAAKFRRVALTGTYDPSKEVLIRSRSLGGAPGRWVATPLVTDDGTAVLVVRGFVPEAISDSDPPVDGVEPPEGRVGMVGYLMPTQTKAFFGSTDAASGALHELSRVDVKRFAKQYGARIAPFWLQLEKQTPATSSAKADLLSAVPLPDLDEGPHFSYAVQWAIFTLIAIIGYPLIIRRVARQPQQAEGSGGAGDDDDDDDDDDDRDGHDPSPDDVRDLDAATHEAQVG